MRADLFLFNVIKLIFHSNFSFNLQIFWILKYINILFFQSFWPPFWRICTNRTPFCSYIWSRLRALLWSSPSPNWFFQIFFGPSVLGFYFFLCAPIWTKMVCIWDSQKHLKNTSGLKISKNIMFDLLLNKNSTNKLFVF
jgi:hypothetical protein